MDIEVVDIRDGPAPRWEAFFLYPVTRCNTGWSHVPVTMRRLACRLLRSAVLVMQSSLRTRRSLLQAVETVQA